MEGFSHSIVAFDYFQRYNFNVKVHPSNNGEGGTVFTTMEGDRFEKKIILAGILLSIFLLRLPGLCPGCRSTQEAAVPIWLCIPFAGLLLCIAIMPWSKANGGNPINPWRLRSGFWL